MRNNKIQISKDELKRLYMEKKMSTINISKAYNCNAETIRRRLYEYGIKRRYREIKIKIPAKELKKLYNQNKMSTLKLAKKYNCSQWTIRSNLLKNNIKLRGCSDFLKWKAPANQINPNISNSPIISYVLGVILGDGWTYNYKHNYFVGLDSIDYVFCKSFFNSLKDIGLNPNIFLRKKCWRTVASSKIFYNWFKTLKFEDIKKLALNYPLHFLRGIYESEGCLLINRDKKGHKKYFSVIIVNTNKKIISLSNLLLKRKGFNPRINLRKPKFPRKYIWVLALNKQKEIDIFLNLIKPCIKNKQKIYK